MCFSYADHFKDTRIEIEPGSKQYCKRWQFVRHCSGDVALSPGSLNFSVLHAEKGGSLVKFIANTT